MYILIWIIMEFNCLKGFFEIQNIKEKVIMWKRHREQFAHQEEQQIDQNMMRPRDMLGCDRTCD